MNGPWLVRQDGRHGDHILAHLASAEEAERLVAKLSAGHPDREFSVVPFGIPGGAPIGD